MKKSIRIAFITIRLFLGGVMISAGAGKFLKHIPSSSEVVEQITTEVNSANKLELQKTLYINGLKQTGYFWELLGLCELFFGIMLLFRRTYFLGALFLLPITLHIFLFHLFLEPDEIGELLYCGVLLIINILMIFVEKNRWKNLIQHNI